MSDILVPADYNPSVKSYIRFCNNL